MFLFFSNRWKPYFEQLLNGRHFSNPEKLFFEEMLNGRHNDELCIEYQQNHKRKFQTDPRPCKYKDCPENIPKLLDKIVISDVQKVSKEFQEAFDQLELD